MVRDDRARLAEREKWAVEQFGQAALGDTRRTRRLVRLAMQMAANSSGSIPQQTGNAADMRAAYRLFAEEDVTHAAICQPHFEQTRAAAQRLPLVFLVQDSAQLNFTAHAHCDGLGPIGRGQMRGLHQQNVLAIDPTTRQPLGLMYQAHPRRANRGKGHRRAAKRRVPLAQRESYWWIEAIRTLGSPPPGVRWVHVGDRGEDVFGVYEECRRQGTDWLIRAARDRKVETPQGPVTLIPPRYEDAYRPLAPISCWLVRVWEPDPPAGVEPLEWILLTSLVCATAEMASFAGQGYSLRWIVEEFHKCEKTGCQVEARRLESVDRLEPLIGLLSVLAVWLLKLKYVARDDPERPAGEVFDQETVAVMASYLRRPAKGLTVRAFWRGIGLLGGHPGRKCDGPVGWLRAWRGWQSFQLILLGARLGTRRRGRRCG